MHSPALASTGVGGVAWAAVHQYKPTVLSSRREGPPFLSPTWARMPLPQSTVSVPAAPEEGRCVLRSRSSCGGEVEGGDVVGRTKGWIHFVGIGGCGVSALAMLALQQGFEVSGSDIVWSDFMGQLHKAGARLHIGHSISNMQRHNDSGLPIAVIISSAIPAENVEVSHAKAVGIPVLVSLLIL
ncbi:hypothetical protein Taro_004101 [Colocasia esculenta]|uniref:Mur ligase N-terminal catalytic domain-containing protein n=1 Tax=Colocasia esculenta TaxID=4460 RepID=A0A843TJ53_COLES|nr:hypothetical protein [Colocasia esculenta]